MTNRQKRLNWIVLGVLVLVVAPISICAQLSGTNDQLKKISEEAGYQAGTAIGNVIGSAIFFLTAPFRGSAAPTAPTPAPIATIAPATPTPRPVFVIPTLTP